MSNPIQRVLEHTTLSRRSFLAGSTAGGLVMAFGGGALLPSAVAALEEKRFAPTVWFEIDSAGTVLVNIAKAEMGQHVGTALARIVADELGADWSKVGIHHVDSDPKWGYMVTGGSWSVHTSFQALSQAGAAGRQVLIEAGAALLGVEPAACRAVNGAIHAGDRSVSFADIVQKGAIDRQFTADELAALPVKNPAERDLIGKPISALDIPAKSTARATYGIDAELPGMLYARPIIPPTRYGSVVNDVDDSKARAIAGYQGFQVLEDPSETVQGWVVALADSQWAAIKAANAIVVDWTPGPTANVDEAAILARGEELAAGDSGALYVKEGDVAAASGEKQLSATYRTHSVLHFTMEPGNALASFTDGTWHLHTGNQWQSLILPVLAKALDVPESQIVIHQYYLGGGFGRRLFGDTMIPAALAAKAVGKPVKLVFTREDDSRFDCVRSASVQTFDGQVADGKTLSVDSAVVAGWPTLAMAPGFLGDGLEDSGKIDPFSASGANHWYTIPNHRVRIINNDLAQKTFLPGWLRTVGPGWTTWGVESFMDELAHAAGADPIEFRLAHLDAAGKNAGEAPNSVGGASRLAHVLRAVREQSGWGRELPDDEALGVAATFGQERNMPTWIGCVAHVKVDRASGAITVKKLWQTIDCGTVVHPDGALAQAEGASLWGVSLALHEGTAFADGQVADRNLDRYTPLRMADVPELDIRFVDSKEFPQGMGEPPLSPVAPAIANAVFAAVGVRLRDLPMRADDLKAALNPA